MVDEMTIRFDNEKAALTKIIRTNKDFNYHKVKKACKEIKFYSDSFDFLNTNKSAVGIVYSGGYDSNCMILRALKEGKLVRPIMFNFADDNNTRIINLAILNKQFPRQILRPFWVDKNIMTVPDGCSEGHGMGQQPVIHFWLGWLPDKVYEQLTEIQIGYIVGDLGVSFKDELQAIYNNSAILRHSHVVPVTYPLSKTTKHEVFDEVPDYLISYSCERPMLNTFRIKGHYILNIENCCDCCYCRENEYVFNHFNKRILVDIPDEYAVGESLHKSMNQRVKKTFKKSECKDVEPEECLKESD